MTPTSNEYALAICEECDRASLRIPIVDWFQMHNPNSGTTEWIPQYDKNSAYKTCGCVLYDNELDQPDVVEYVYV